MRIVNVLDRNVHKAILLQILKEIYTDTSLGPVLGFKGGTAANLFHNLARFSIDLDFDLLDESKEERVFKKVEKIISAFGLIKESRKKRHTIFFLLSYGERAQNIKIEINKRNFGSRYELKNYLGISMLAMVKEDMFAHKLVAMLERGKAASRDVFDVWFFLKNNWEINGEIVERRTGMKLRGYLKKCIEFVKLFSNRNILSGMGELLDEKTKAYAKGRLLADTLFLLKVRLEMV